MHEHHDTTSDYNGNDDDSTGMEITIPTTIKRPTLRDVPYQLLKLKQWVVWRGKKIPHSPIDRKPCGASAAHSERWGTAEEAFVAMEEGDFEGVGFVFTNDDPFVGIDLDAALDAEAGKVAKWAKPFLKRCLSYMETSVSGTGLHIICKGRTSDKGAKAPVKNAPVVNGKKPAIEIYSADRFFVFTGVSHRLTNAIEQDQGFIEYVEEAIAKHKQKAGNSTTKTVADRPDEDYHISDLPLEGDDAALVERLSKGHKAFAELWEGDISRFDEDHSKADFALACILLEHSGKNVARAVRIFTASELGQREKWQQRIDYRRSTIEAAYKSCRMLGFVPDDDAQTEAMEKFGPPFEIEWRKDGGTIRMVHEAFFAGHYSLTHHVFWSAQEQGFFQYDTHTGLFTVCHKETIRTSISAFILSFSRRDWSSHGITSVTALGTARKSRFLDAVIEHLKGIVFEVDPFPKRTGMMLHLSNGVLVHRGGGDFVVEPFSPDFRSRNACPLNYKPGADAPKFLEMLRRGLPHHDDIELLLRYMFQCFAGRNLKQRMLVVGGPPGNGKSTLLGLVKELVGSNNHCELRPGRLDNNFEQARFIGRTLLTGCDVPGNYLSLPGAQRLKALVGGDTLSPERKFSNEVHTIRGEFNVIITTNEQLSICVNGDAGAWRRRLLVIDFNGPPLPDAQKIDEFEQVLMHEEGSGILNMVLDAGRRMLADTGKNGGFPLNATQECRIDRLLGEAERVRTFVKTCLGPAKGSYVTTQQIVEHYTEFAEMHGWPVYASSHSLGRAAKGAISQIFGIGQSHSLHDDDDGNEVRGYRGLRFIAETPEPTVETRS